LNDAIFKENRELVEELLATDDQALNNADKNGLPPLHVAIFTGSKELVELLMSKGADIDARDPYGLTPLDSAISKGKKDIAELLSLKGVNVESKRDKDGRPPLVVAVENGYKEIV